MARYEKGKPLTPFYRSVLQSYAAYIGGQHILAERLGVNRITVNRWLNGWACGHYDECVAFAMRAVMERPEIAEVASRSQFKPRHMDVVNKARFVQQKLGISYQKATQIAPILLD
jgi:hypothetical protein